MLPGKVCFMGNRRMIWFKSVICLGTLLLLVMGIILHQHYVNLMGKEDNSQAQSKEYTEYMLYEKQQVPESPMQYDETKIYVNGDLVEYEGQIYKAKWWTKSLPGSDQSWMQVESSISFENIITSEGTAEFKIVGYYPSWQPDKVDSVQYDKLTNIIYAFAIPDGEGELMDLENPDTAYKLIENAHANGVKVSLAIGGWSYEDIPLESAFVSGTDTDDKIDHFATEIVDMMDAYGFDGIDMDWEHPHKGDSTEVQYEKLMIKLREKMGLDKILTSAVIGGVTPDGRIEYNAAAHSDTVISVVDWFNVMAYDGGDGERHSGLPFAIYCGAYWRYERNMPANKVVLGVPFYGRPSWAPYWDILSNDPEAFGKDTSNYGGLLTYYNGIPTMKQKTQWACENLGGIMIWELSQDTSDPETSLLNAIYETARENGKIQ